ncbi:MAG: lytic transglycosylase domain-containing protein [Nitrospirae bacterium]|nr:lytic transglycosylase domain-containing protein [Nitrospirota bacterium]
MKPLRSFTVFICLIIPSLSAAFCFEEAGARFGINPRLLEGISVIESGQNPAAMNINRDGSRDMGLMQINSSWIPRLGLEQARLLTDPCYNVMAGARILGSCINAYGYSWVAVGCYNAVSRSKRADYSWKVYNLLRSEGNRAGSGANTGGAGGQKAFTHSPEKGSGGQGDSSLIFSVKDIFAFE